jgi:hypothetical protein
MLQPPNKTALKGQDNLGGLSWRFTRLPISAEFTMVGSNKMRIARLTNFGYVWRMRWTIPTYVADTFFRRVIEQSLLLTLPWAG